jgi:TonB family protein
VGPFRLHARMRNFAQEPVDADYLLIWAAADRWREEISIGTQHAIRIGGVGTVSSKQDSEQTQSARSQFLFLDVSARLQVKPGESLSGVKTRNHGSIQCVSRTAKLMAKTESCFDATTGVLVREEAAGFQTAEFSNYLEFRGKLFPRLLKIFRNGKLNQEIEVQELAHDPEPAGSLFEPDAQYKTLPGCEHPVSPTPIKLPDPEYPAQLRTRTAQQVGLSFIVNESGSVQDILVTRSAGALDQYAIKALEKWKFVPATCGGVAVPVQFHSVMDFKTY